MTILSFFDTGPVVSEIFTTQKCMLNLGWILHTRIKQRHSGGFLYQTPQICKPNNQDCPGQTEMCAISGFLKIGNICYPVGEMTCRQPDPIMSKMMCGQTDSFVGEMNWIPI
ncbi:uncharacterized protein LOC118761202 isoform X2 [Octopus sinensis]|uniref:Uncharacterized protein LOC118761202 isoform X2 n=1 Tax=Octopus sinensis TaxID=2607531 RepID=A0A7E6EGX6_9MOLL|nr:uncharacterized protein LOC118761202 isoform X2 [Octopus sinensis]